MSAEFLRAATSPPRSHHHTLAYTSTQKKVKMIMRPPHGVEEEVIAYDEDVVISRK